MNDTVATVAAGAASRAAAVDRFVDGFDRFHHLHLSPIMLIIATLMMLLLLLWLLLMLQLILQVARCSILPIAVDDSFRLLEHQMVAWIVGSVTVGRAEVQLPEVTDHHLVAVARFPLEGAHDRGRVSMI